jgi:pimeloyl-ACP methyl ester carboxylesterase
VQCFCLSGLGADHRLFSRLSLPDGLSLHDLPWLPNEPDEPIAHYAGRMKAAIQQDNPILLSVSFGGMMAIEIAKLYPFATVILVSSIRNRLQRPAWMSLCGRLNLHRVLLKVNPPRKGPLRNGLAPLENYFQGIESSEDAKLYTDFRNHIDFDFTRWAIGEILRWKNEWAPASIYHLQGGRDRIFPLSPKAVTQYLPDGGHFMVYNRAEWVSRQLAAILYSL